MAGKDAVPQKHDVGELDRKVEALGIFYGMLWWRFSHWTRLTCYVGWDVVLIT
jgi:hypothetical protein